MSLVDETKRNRTSKTVQELFSHIPNDIFQNNFVVTFTRGVFRASKQFSDAKCFCYKTFVLQDSVFLSDTSFGGACSQIGRAYLRSEQ